MDTQKRIIIWSSVVLITAIAAIGTYQVATSKPTQLPRKDGALSMPLDTNDHTKGVKTPKVTLVEYSDFQCPACGLYYPMVESVYTQYKDRISFTYRHFPLPQHQNALVAGYASEAAANQGKFWEMADYLFKNQAEWSDLSNADAQSKFETYAQKIGLDIVKFKADSASDAVKNRVERDRQSGNLSAVDHTPLFFINGKKADNPNSIEEFKALIEYAITHPN